MTEQVRNEGRYPDRPKRIGLGSMFRDSVHYLARYFDQVDRLEEQVGPIQFYWVEGDSLDETWQQLAQPSHRAVHLIKRAHGGPPMSGIDDPGRWSRISFVCNGLLELVEPTIEQFIYVESDLIWEPETLAKLLRHLATVEVVGTMCFSRADGHFYDTWGHRSGGIRFSPCEPYHPALPRSGLMPMDSMGSCLAMRGQVARTARFNPPEEGIVGWCSDMRRHGYRLWLDPSLAVYHP